MKYFHYFSLHKKYYSPLLLNRKWRLTSFSFDPLYLSREECLWHSLHSLLHYTIFLWLCNSARVSDKKIALVILVDRLSPIILQQIGHKSSTYLSPNYSFKASWTGQWPINCMMQLWGKNWDWDMCLLYDDQACCKAGCQSNHLTSNYIMLKDLFKFVEGNRKYIA